jgi:hypothetical protein
MGTKTKPRNIFDEVSEYFDKNGSLPTHIPPEHLRELRDAVNPKTALGKALYKNYPY